VEVGMYLMRLVYDCKRGKTGEVIECLKILNEVYTRDGCTKGRISVDRMGRMDRAIFEFEVESLDQFYARLRERYANPSPRGQELIARLNENTVEGTRELYEVIE
jgi:hypothetical protein